MCGISGIYNYSDKDKFIEPHLLHRMTEVLSHRGPDGKGYYVKDNIGLGHSRLAIIDLFTGDQPIFNETKTIVVVFNGEIYNFIALREMLSEKGHRFYTKSDTEVIAHLYEEKGESFVESLRGMFALAIWDQDHEKLILARDRVGIKPLFYSCNNGTLLFGSEIKSILIHSSYKKEIDFESLHNYLSFMTTTGKKTIFKGINRLLPAEMLVCAPGKIEKKIYWQPPQKTSIKKISLEYFYEQLLEVTKLHLLSDVPLGAFLSGGLDSSAVVALMHAVAREPIKTFSIGFSGKGYYNELPYAKKIAEYFKTDHHEFVVTPDLVDALPKIIEYFDEPFAVSSALPTYFLAQLARKEVKVVLTGDGADELMAGYHHRYLGVRLSRYFDQLPFLKSLPLEKAIGFFLTEKRAKLHKFFSALSVSKEERYFRYLAKYSEDQKGSLYSGYLRTRTASFDSRNELISYYLACGDKDILNRWLYVDMKTSLPDEMLTKVDRMTMAFGLEARVPFLDHALVEYLCSLPSAFKLKNFTPKYILRNVMLHRLPGEIIHRKKHGFEVPVDEWIRGSLKEYVREFLNESRIEKEGFFSWEFIKTMLTRHWGHKANFGHQVWILLIFEIWYEKYFGGQKAEL